MAQSNILGRDSGAREAGDNEPDRITTDPGGMTRGSDPKGIGVSKGGGKGSSLPGRYAGR